MSLPDLRALLTTLADASVQFVVVGGIALGLHGHVRTTADLDIVPDPDPANLDRLCALLEAEQATLLLAPSRRFAAREGWMLRRGRNVSVTTRHGDLDVIRAIPGVPSYDELLEDAERYDVDGLTVIVASPSKLIEMKQARNNAQDRADIAALRETD
jgi:predicted nucleotidyltransferase